MSLFLNYTSSRRVASVMNSGLSEVSIPIRCSYCVPVRINVSLQGRSVFCFLLLIQLVSHFNRIVNIGNNGKNSESISKPPVGISNVMRRKLEETRGGCKRVNRNETEIAAIAVSCDLN
ncbi:hypothetical protein V6N13_079047 [Hibiscus sabdariffa]